MPIFKSVADNLVHFYIYMNYNMDIPFTFANVDEIPQNKVLEAFAHNAGLVHQNRNPGQGI